MKVLKITNVVLLTLLIATFFSPINSSKAQAATVYTGTVKVKQADVRKGPGTKYAKIGSYKKGSKITVYSKTKSGWSEIKYKEKKAYVLTKYLTLTPKPKKTTTKSPSNSKSSTKSSKPAIPTTKPKPPEVPKPSKTFKFSSIAHRGASGLYPEHTYEAYNEALRLGVDYIEIDLRITLDGEFVAIHDSTVDRTTNGTGMVNTYTLQQLKELDAGYKFYNRPTTLKILTLDEILKRYSNTTKYYIEVKTIDNRPNAEKELLDILTKNNIKIDQVVIQSFELPVLERIHLLNSKVKLVHLLKVRTPAELQTINIDNFEKIGYGIGINHQYITKEFVTSVKNRGLEIHVYTADLDKDIQRSLDLGVTGIFTDYPNRLMTALKTNKPI